jgi:hypothetical protein
LSLDNLIDYYQSNEQIEYKNACQIKITVKKNIEQNLDKSGIGDRKGEIRED